MGSLLGGMGAECTPHGPRSTSSSAAAVKAGTDTATLIPALSYRWRMDDRAVIRSAVQSEAMAVAALSRELGYEIDAKTAACQITRLRPESAAFIALVAGEPTGWVQLFRTDLLQTTPFAEIGGLVVTATSRGTGVGGALVAAAETWAVERGLHEVRLRSRVTREGAHRFYERLGYAVEKTSYAFRKQLANPSPRRDREE